MLIAVLFKGYVWKWLELEDGIGLTVAIKTSEILLEKRKKEMENAQIIQKKKMLMLLAPSSLQRVKLKGT